MAPNEGRLDRLNAWLLLASHLGIIASLVLVALQMRQDQELTRAQLYSDATTARMELHYRMMDPETARVVIRSISDPAALTLEELRVMDSYLLAAVNENRRRLVISSMDLDAEYGAAENSLMFYFGNRFAKTWWDRFKGEGEVMDSALVTLDREIAGFDDDWTMTFFEELLVDLEQGGA